MLCNSCKNDSLGVHCPAGNWEVCNESDEDAIKFETSCYKCGLRGHIYMKGKSFMSTSNMFVAPCKVG